MAAPGSEKILSLAALGRPFHLGMLYDCRSDKLITGITLWDKQVLDDKVIQPQENSDFHVIVSDSLDDKASALDVNASLKLSFLGGLLEVSGSAKYLDNRKSSSHQEQVTLQYKCTTRSEEMTMEQLGKGRIQHPEVFDHGTATHVVTGVEYGAQAFFVFDRQHSSSSNSKQIDGSLHVLVKSIPGMMIDGEGKLEISENDKKKTESFSCRFFGDFLLRENPSSFQDAVKVYKEIPKLLGKDGQNSVPIRVRLYPLTLLDSKASRLVREISINLMYEVEKMLEEFHKLNVKCNDLYNSDATKKFQTLLAEISTFKGLINTYKCGFQRKLCLLLPRIRGGGVEESQLLDILKCKETSPFSTNALKSWIQDKEKQVKIITEYVKSLSDIKFASEPGDIESTVMNVEHTYTLCFMFLLPKSNPQINLMMQCIQNEEGQSVMQQYSVPKNETGNDDSSMFVKARLFRDFAASNKNNSEIAFILGEDKSDSEGFKAQIWCYKLGQRISCDYDLPSAPTKAENVFEECTHSSLSIQWEMPEHGSASTEQYKVVCQEVKKNKSFEKFTGSKSPMFTVSDLKPNFVYQISVQSICEAGLGPCSDTALIATKPTSPPGKPQAWRNSATTVALQWSHPECVGQGCKIDKYIVSQKQENIASWHGCMETESGEVHTCIVKVLPNRTWRFKITADCGVAGTSVASELGESITLTATSTEITKEAICASSEFLTSENLRIYKPKLKLILSRDNDMIAKYEFGKPKQSTPEKVIMVVGATGSGKTTLINGIVNYVFGVDWNDSFRFKLIVEPNSLDQSKSQTTNITSYTIHHQEGFKIPYTLTIIDTPGFGDVSGVMRDKQITQQIRSFFTTGGAVGVDHIDAIGFVAQSSLPRLTPTQKYIFDQILALFGKDIADNIYLLLTFADGQKPQVLSGINESGMPYRKHFKFNNSALFANNVKTTECSADESDSNDDGDDNFDKMFWQMGTKSFKVFLQQLNNVESKSLTLTRDVLNERNRIEVHIIGIQQEIHTGLNTLEKLKKEVEIVKAHQADIDKNKNFNYTVDEETFEKEEIPSGQYITNCLQCNRTCHEVCGIRDDNRKAGCWAMTNDNCRICPSKCHWSVHKNFPYKFVCKRVTVTKTAEDLRKRYQEATDKKLTAENLISKIQEEFESVHLKVLVLTESVRKSLQRLKEIALKPNPLSTAEYIDILIDSEKSSASPGWQERVEQLRTVRKEAEYMQQIADKGFDPFKEYRAKLQKEKDSNKKGVWSKVEEYIGDFLGFSKKTKK